MKYRSNNYLIPLLFIACTLACQRDSTTAPAEETYFYQIPPKVDDGWEVASLSDAGMKEAKLIEMMNFIHQTTDHRIHSIVIIKDEKLVFEEYFEGFLFDTDQVQSQGPLIKYNRDTLHFMASVSKSVTSAAFGIAVDQGLVQNVDKKVIEYYPQYSTILTGQKSDITVKQLLTMTAGLAWDESSYPYGDSRNDVSGLFNTRNPIKFILEKPLETSPGLRFHYNSGYANILADIVKLHYDGNFKEFADEELFAPLNIRTYRWDMIGGDYIFASGGLYLKSRDLAKIGQLYLNKGTWKNQRLLSQEWVAASVQNYINPGAPNFATGYGYQWWLNTFQTGEKYSSCFMAVGWGDQLMFVFPQEKMVVVMTCGNFLTSAAVSPHSLVRNYILAAL